MKDSVLNNTRSPTQFISITPSPPAAAAALPSATRRTLKTIQDHARPSLSRFLSPQQRRTPTGAGLIQRPGSSSTAGRSKPRSDTTADPVQQRASLTRLRRRYESRSIPRRRGRCLLPPTKSRPRFSSSSFLYEVHTSRYYLVSSVFPFISTPSPPPSPPTTLFHLSPNPTPSAPLPVPLRSICLHPTSFPRPGPRGMHMSQRTRSNQTRAQTRRDGQVVRVGTHTFSNDEVVNSPYLLMLRVGVGVEGERTLCSMLR